MGEHHLQPWMALQDIQHLVVLFFVVDEGAVTVEPALLARPVGDARGIPEFLRVVDMEDQWHPFLVQLCPIGGIGRAVEGGHGQHLAHVGLALDHFDAIAAHG